MIVAFSALARRTAASNARREIAWPVNGSRMRRTGRGRSRRAAARAAAASSRRPRRRRARPARRPMTIDGSSSALDRVFLGAPRAVGDDAHVDARAAARIEPLRQRRRAAARGRAPGATAAEQHVGRARARARRRATAAGTSSDSSTSSCGAEHRGELAQRLPATRSSSSARRSARRADPQQVEVGAQPLGRAPRPPHQPLGAGVRLDQREQPLADRLRRASAALVARAADLGDAAAWPPPPRPPGAARPRAARRGSRSGRSCSARRRCARPDRSCPPAAGRAAPRG